MDYQDETPRENIFKRILDATPRESLEGLPNETLRETLLKVFSEQVRYSELFAEESDRGAAVLAHALFDERLGDVLKLHNEALTGQKFTFLIKVEIAYALRLFDRETRMGLLAINTIRNKFAHSTKQIDFRDKKVVALCSKLKPKPGPPTTDLRERYLTYLRDVEVSVRHSRAPL